jgi:hypothetical protein
MSLFPYHRPHLPPWSVLVAALRHTIWNLERGEYQDLWIVKLPVWLTTQVEKGPLTIKQLQQAGCKVTGWQGNSYQVRPTREDAGTAFDLDWLYSVLGALLDREYKQVAVAMCMLMLCERGELTSEAIKKQFDGLSVDEVQALLDRKPQEQQPCSNYNSSSQPGGAEFASSAKQQRGTQLHFSRRRGRSCAPPLDSSRLPRTHSR